MMTKQTVRFWKWPVICRSLFVFGLLVSFLGAVAAQNAPLLPNGGFEGGSGDNGRGGGVPGWQPFEKGYTVDRQTHRGGDQSIRCDSVRLPSLRGAQALLELNQARPIPVQVSGWSRSDSVSGVKDNDYALYIDVTYTDGTTLWGLVAPFRTGTHDWERRQVLVLPAKPIKTLTIYALFRNHTGTVWFDDFSATPLSGAGLFDSQGIAPLTHRTTLPATLSVRTSDGLKLGFTGTGEIASVQTGGQEIRSNAAGGFFVRDVAADGALSPLKGTARLRKTTLMTEGNLRALNLRYSAKVIPQGDSLLIDGEINDTTGKDRAITVYFALPVQADGWQWGQDIRHPEKISPEREYTNQTRVNVGATGGLSLYPFGSIASPQTGVAYASQMDWPSVYRIFYNGRTRQFVMAWDFALTSRTTTWPARNARFRFRLFRLTSAEAKWGFRAAAARFYRLNQNDFTRRAKAEGIWIPFTDPANVQNPADFSFAYHEGNNSIKSDDKLGILSFRYTEPMSYWMPMPVEMPRTYENALALLKKQAVGGEGISPEARDASRAVLNSGTMDSDGRFNLEFRNEPWANGAVFALNPNPDLPASAEQPTKAWLNYNLPMAATMYGEKTKAEKGEQDGEYLDSLEAWSDVLDYRPEHLKTSPYPVTFESDSRQAVVPEWYQTHAFTRFLRDDLHNRGKLLMANSTPIRFSIYTSLCDVMGIETNWLNSSGAYEPDSDETFNLRRTLSYQKPYLLLQNTNFDKFLTEYVEKYFLRCLFYGVYPSMFSVDAANNPYWDTPRWYNRDRPLFKKYLPLVKQVSSAGWEPITYARVSTPLAYVERYGKRLFTLLNSSDKPLTVNLTIEHALLGFKPVGGRLLHPLSGEEVLLSAISLSNGSSDLSGIVLAPGETALIELR